MESTMTPLSLDDPFPFSCSPEVSCFNACCRDLNQFLTPYDILRLKKGLGLSSSALLSRYTVLNDGPQTGLPVVSLRPKNGSEIECPFVTPKGCAVYKHRPSSCRTYPLARAVTRSRETGSLSEHYALLKEPHCCGHAIQKFRTVREWVIDQGLADYHKINDLFLSIISLKNRSGHGPLDLKSKHLFYLALYDLDAFRAQIKTQGILDGDPPDRDTRRRIESDDVALLEFAHAWIAKVL